MAILTCLLYIRLAATLLRLCAIEILSINKPNGAGSLFHGTLVKNTIVLLTHVDRLV